MKTPYDLFRDAFETLTPVFGGYDVKTITMSTPPPPLSFEVEMTNGTADYRMTYTEIEPVIGIPTCAGEFLMEGMPTPQPYMIPISEMSRLIGSFQKSFL